jgi:tetratricopeptide (TPR) repeat protein
MMTKRLSAALLACAAALLAVCGPSRARADFVDDPRGHASRASELTTAMEYDKARAELAKADPNSPAVMLAKARLALYEEDCDLAAALLARAEVGQAEEGRLIADVARGCARVTAATYVDRDEANGIIIRYQDDADRSLTPLLVDTVQKARVSLARDLGVEWKLPTRITVVRDLLSLSAMTGLPYKAAQTTGTVAVAKWGRVTLLSPRASHHGYPFRDTLTHELTHLAIAMQSRDRAPLWLHEGVARREEVRWREPGVFDDRPSPESIVLRGMELKLDLALDKLGPSIAMLPSADAAMVAFAEVTSFIKYFVESSAPDALPKLLVALRTAKSADDALKEVSHETLAQWDVRWRAQLAKRAKEPLSPMFGLGAAPAGLGDSRERSRLAELLLGRGHPSEALLELEKIPPEMLADPSLRYLRARVLEADGNARQAEALVEDPKAWLTSYGPCWSVRGRLARARGDAAVADASFAEALAYDPFGVESACQTLPDAPSAGGAGALGVPLCETARKRGDPDLGRE